MEVEAHARYMRITPRKARLVAATVVGMPVKDALTHLDFTPRAAAPEVATVVTSAAANASNNFSQDEDALLVKRIEISDGPTLKRGRPRARGMYFSIFKRTCHITAVVETGTVGLVEPKKAEPSPAAPAKSGAPARPATRGGGRARPAATGKKETAEAEAKETP
jgi:large subunit ribosomal protein L22